MTNDDRTGTTTDSPPQRTASGATTTRPAGSGERYAVKAVVASAVGYAMDGFDLLIIGFALTAITATFSLSTTQAGSLATVTLVGAVVGGLVFGVLSDYVGRVRVLTWSILIFALFTGLSALAWDYWSLASFRFIAGIGLGGEFGIGMTLAAEAWPAKARARATAWVANGWQAGTLLAAGLSALVLPHGGWRMLFLIGAVPAIVAYFLRRHLEEPEKFVEIKESGRRIGFPIRHLVADGPTTRTSIGVLMLASIQNFGYYGIIIWLPTHLASDLGYSYNKSAAWTAVTVLGMVIGVHIFGRLADGIGRRPSFLIFQAGAAVSVLAYANLDTSTALLLGGAVMGVFVNGMMGGYGALMAELYPTEARATAQNVLWNIARAIAGFAPLVVAAIAASQGFSFAIGVLSCLYVIDMLALLLIPERKGAELT